MSSGTNAAPKIQFFDPATVQVNKAILARKGDPDKKRVKELASNFFDRRESGRSPQIQPGIVRVSDDGTVEVIAGRHRLAADLYLNSQDGVGDPFEFMAIAVPANDEQALIDAIEENEWRTATDVFDRAEAMSKLVDLKKTHAEIAIHFNCKESTVSETLRLGKAPAKIKKMVKDGLMTEEAAYVFARYNDDPKTQEELVNLATATREALSAIEDRAANKADAETEAEQEQAEEGDSKGKKKSKGSAPTSEAVKGKKKAASKKVTASDAKDAVKKKGVAKRKTETAKGRSKKDLVLFLEAMVGSDDIAEPIKELAGVIERYLDEDIGERGLQNSFEKCCKAKFTAASAA